MTDDDGKQRRKPDELRKEESIRIRVSAAEKEKLTQAAQRRGLGISSWLLSVGLEAADAQERNSR